ncbi:hypothetical protein [Paenibacillus sp. FSL R7-0337]|uniref:hypothetical protein n=1 Tax=Paenibacillus sp. FSL R7-0337 TaxID=1926588 RepID=UPI0009F8791D|nr:hypothetical protein [Paenibacillus sp. FSL R7-0337]
MNEFNVKQFTIRIEARRRCSRPLLLVLMAILLISSLTACSGNSSAGEEASPSTQPASPSALPAQLAQATPVATPLTTKATGQIYLYGESHGVAKIMDKEYEAWSDYYHNKGMRHLFVEQSYYAAEYLNLWMQSDNDDILEELYQDWEGTPGHVPYTKTFFQKIKSGCPDTIFHGTDVGHQRDKTGKRFLSYLADNNPTGSEMYTLTTEAIQQGLIYYRSYDNVYRENKMAENFIREFEKLGSENIMGIYGAAHTGVNEMERITQAVPCMANQLRKHYGRNLHSEDISWMAKDIEPLRVDEITMQGKKYAASYFGKSDLSGFKDYAFREFWRLEGAYADASKLPLTDNVLTYDQYPMLIEKGQVFAISYTKTDGTTEREYHVANGKKWEDMDATVQIKVTE